MIIHRTHRQMGLIRFFFMVLNTMVFFLLLTEECVLADGYKGEKILYGISPAGKAEYSDLGEVDSEGKRLNCVTFKTQAMGLNDTERIYIDKRSHLPVKIEREVSLWFDKEHLVERYDQKNYVLTIDKFKNNKSIKRYVFKKDGPIQNAILLPFYLRTIGRLDIGWEIKARIPEKYIIRLQSLEEIRIPAGKFMAYHFISVPSKFEIWISRDGLRIPLKIKGLGGFGYTLVMKKHFFPRRKLKEDK